MIQNILKKLSNELDTGFIPNETYILIETFHVPPISKLEYFLKSLGLIKRQSDMSTAV